MNTVSVIKLVIQSSVNSENLWVDSNLAEAAVECSMIKSSALFSLPDVIPLKLNLPTAIILRLCITMQCVRSLQIDIVSRTPPACSS